MIKEVVYQNSYRVQPKYLEVWTFYKDSFSQYKKFIWISFLSNFRASYRKSFFGILWKIVLPLVPVLVYVVLQWFGMLRASQDIPAVLYVVIGMTFWQLFTSSVLSVMSASLKERSLLRKNKMPFILFYVSSLGEVIFDYIVRLVLIFTLLSVYGASINLSWLFLPLMFIPILLLGLTLGIFLSFWSIFYSDFKNIVEIILRYGLFASGVLFPLPKTGMISQILNLNPVYILLNNCRSLLIFGSFDDLGYFLIINFVIVFFLTYSLKKLYSLEPVLREYL